MKASTLIQLCNAQPSDEELKKDSGRRSREIVARLFVMAGMWLEEYGVPVAGSGGQADLERFLAAEADGQLKSESRIREIAVQAIGIARARKKAAI